MTHAGADDLVVTRRITVVLEHEVVAIAAQQLLVGDPHRLERVLARLRRAPLLERFGGRREGVCDPLKASVQRGQEQLALAGEEAEHIRLSDSHAARDALHRSPVQPPVRELVHRCGDQLLAALCRGHPSACLLGPGARYGVHSLKLAATNKFVKAPSEEPGERRRIPSSP